MTGATPAAELNRAARLLSLAHGGQVLVSDASEALLRDRVALRPLGEHRLRGLRGRMSVHQLVADGLPADFPVLRGGGDFTGNLPQQLSSLVGREELIEEVAELVRSCRLVTLTGVGGVGKTRLALEVGAELADEFPDGVWMVELASVSDPAAVPAAIATALGVTPQGDAPLIEAVAESLGGRQLLLVARQLRARPRRGASRNRGDARPCPATSSSSPRRARPSRSTTKRCSPWRRWHWTGA